VYVVLYLVVAASSSLLLSNKFTSQSFLLNGMAIGFASNLDDLFSFITISEKERQRVEEKVEEIMADEGRQERCWRRNRVYGAVLAVTLVVAVVLYEDLIQYRTWGTRWVGWDVNPAATS
jgi:hypothetical protein